MIQAVQLTVEAKTVEPPAMAEFVMVMVVVQMFLKTRVLVTAAVD